MVEEKAKETKEKNKRLPIAVNSRGLVLRSMDDMWRFACAVKDSGLAPSSFTKPEQILIALQSGAELGMPPMRSLQSLCVINGAARLWGDAPLALVRQSGLLGYIKEHIKGEGDDRIAICETLRKGDSEPKITSFSVDDAKQAGLWTKKGTWQQYPERMLTYRARSFNLRDNFPDCFGGSTIAEEYEGLETPEPSHETSTPKRKEVEAKQIDTPNPESDTNQAAEEAILGVFELFEQVEDEPTIENFATLSAEVCGGEKDDYWIFDDDVEPTLNPDAYTPEKLERIKEILEGTDKLGNHPEPEKAKKENEPLYRCKAGHEFEVPKSGSNGATLCPKCFTKDISLIEEANAK